MKPIPFLAALAAASLALPAIGGPIYRCDVNGATVFSDRPCAADAEVVEIDTSPTGMGGHLRAGEWYMLRDAAERDLRQQHQKDAATNRWNRHHVGYSDQLKIKNLERKRDAVIERDGGVGDWAAIDGYNRQIEQLRAPKW